MTLETPLCTHQRPRGAVGTTPSPAGKQSGDLGSAWAIDIRLGVSDLTLSKKHARVVTRTLTCSVGRAKQRPKRHTSVDSSVTGTEAVYGLDGMGKRPRYA